MKITDEEKSSYDRGIGKRLTLKGVTTEYETFKIPLEKLFYNDQNGRIAIAMDLYRSKHPSDKPLSELLHENQTAYNEIVVKFFRSQEYADKSEIEALNKTEKDIEKRRQKEPGVVLDDGRVIDGNRRFTALWSLYKKTADPQYGYFEAVILPTPRETDINGWKEIKRLELDIQFNVDEKQGYKPMDRLLDFYRTTINPETRQLDKREYLQCSGMKPADYDKCARECQIMIDFLRYIGRSEDFYLLKAWKLDGPFNELATHYKELNSETWNVNKGIFYNYIYVSKSSDESGDITRNIRQLVESFKAGGETFHAVKKEMEKPAFREDLETALGASETDEAKRVTRKLASDAGAALSRGVEFEKTSKKQTALKDILEKVLREIEPLLTDSNALFLMGSATTKERREILDQIEIISRTLTNLACALWEKAEVIDKPEAAKYILESLSVIINDIENVKASINR